MGRAEAPSRGGPLLLAVARGALLGSPALAVALAILLLLQDPQADPALHLSFQIPIHEPMVPIARR